MRILFVATSNAGKLRDFAAAAEIHGLVVQALPGIAAIEAPEENAATFEGNARDKAVYYSRFAPGEIVVADDSGLEVDALCGAPGVRSARYALDALEASNHTRSARARQAEGGSLDADEANENEPRRMLGLTGQIDRDNNELLLRNMRSTPEEQRGARYRCVLAAAKDGEVWLTADGVVHGRILASPSGTGGFGYDPLFYLPDRGKSMAEIDLDEKNAISHRGRAFRALLEKMKGRQS